MTPKKLYIDSNYPLPVVRVLQDIHSLQEEERVLISTWSDESIPEEEIENAFFLIMDFQKRGFSIPVLKQAQDGYKTIVCKCGEKMERFELMMTVLRVWPKIFEELKNPNGKTLLSFKYGGKKLVPYNLEEMNKI